MSTQGTTTAGVLIGVGEILVVPETSADGTIGNVVRTALSESKSGVPHPQREEEWKKLMAPLLKACAVKSWSKFMQGALYVSVEANGNTVKFMPFMNLGPKRGFQSGQYPVSIEVLMTDSDQILGRAVLQALQLARSGPRSITSDVEWVH